MQYVIYVAVVAPLLFGWLFWEASHTPPQAPLFASGLESLSTRPLRETAAVPAPRRDVTRKLARNEDSSTD